MGNPFARPVIPVPEAADLPELAAAPQALTQRVSSLAEQASQARASALNAGRDMMARARLSVAADEHGDEGTAAEARQVQGDGEMEGADEATEGAAEGATEGVAEGAEAGASAAATAGEGLAVGAAAEGFLDPFADVLALAGGLGMLALGETAKKSLPSPPQALRSTNPSSVIGV